MKLQDGQLNWKVILNYAVLRDAFLLDVNGVSFSEMPLQTEVNKEGPQNIIQGRIILNGQEVHSGFVQYTADTFEEMHSEIEYEPVTDIKIKDFGSTSTEVLNSVIDELGRAVDEEQGL